MFTCTSHDIVRQDIRMSHDILFSLDSSDSISGMCKGSFIIGQYIPMACCYAMFIMQ